MKDQIIGATIFIALLAFAFPAQSNANIITTFDTGFEGWTSR